MWIFKSRDTKKSFHFSLTLNLHSNSCTHSKLEIMIHFLNQLFSCQNANMCSEESMNPWVLYGNLLWVCKCMEVFFSRRYPYLLSNSQRGSQLRTIKNFISGCKQLNHTVKFPITFVGLGREVRFLRISAFELQAMWKLK